MLGGLLVDGEPDEWEVELILIVLFHGGDIEARPLELHILALLTKALDYLLQLFAFEQAVGSKQTNVKGLRPVEVLGMVVEDIHILQFLRDNYFFLQQSPYQLIGEGSQGICDMLGYFKVDDRHFLAFGVLIEPREVVDSCELQWVFREDAVYVCLEVAEEGAETGLCGLVAENEFEESEVGQLVTMFAQDLWGAVLGTGVQSFSELLLKLEDLLALVGQPQRKGGKVREEGAVFDYVLVLVRHYIFFYKPKSLNAQRNLYILLCLLNSLSNLQWQNQPGLMGISKMQYTSRFAL